MRAGVKGKGVIPAIKQWAKTPAGRDAATKAAGGRGQSAGEVAMGGSVYDQIIALSERLVDEDLAAALNERFVADANDKAFVDSVTASLRGLAANLVAIADSVETTVDVAA